MVNLTLSLIRKGKGCWQNTTVSDSGWVSLISKARHPVVVELGRKVKHDLSHFTVKHLIDNLRNPGQRHEVMRLHQRPMPPTPKGLV